MKDRTTEYAKLIVNSKKLCGHAEYLACKRHLDNIADKDFEYTFDVARAEKHINLANELTIGEGITTQKLSLNFQLGCMKAFNSSFEQIDKMDLELLFELVAVQNKVAESLLPENKLVYIDEILPI